LTSELHIGGRGVGNGFPCFVIGEAGVNHNGDLELAHRLVDAVADAGADAVKFQTFRPEALVAAGVEAAPYQRSRGAGSQAEMLAELVLPGEAWAELAEHATARGLAFLSTAFDLESAEIVRDLKAPALKIPSGELTNLPFIRRLASFGIPLIVSTGMGTMEEVAEAVLAADWAPGVVLLHCVSAYPAPVADANLRVLPTLRDAFDVPVGWSDHTVGSVTAVIAVALGAAVLEKHVTLDRSMRGPDHAASADPAEFAAYVRDVRDAEAALGHRDKRPVASEEENRFYARRSHHAARDLEAGHLLAPEDVVLMRPEAGLAPRETVVGRRLGRAVRAGSPLRAEDLE